MTRAPSRDLADKIHQENIFRFALSLITFAIAAFLWAFAVFASIRPLLILVFCYNLCYPTVEAIIRRSKAYPFFDYFLIVTDVIVISTAIYLTGGPKSPFFYLYIFPFLIHAFHFDEPAILYSGILSLLSYAILLLTYTHRLSARLWLAYGGQWIFLCVVMVTACVIVHSMSRQERKRFKGVAALEATVSFLNRLNGLPMEWATERLQKEIIAILSQLLIPFQTYARLWIYNDPWKSLHGEGKHPGLRPGSPSNLPVHACPVFTVRRSFRYVQGEDPPCPSEQFDYAAHLCLPLSNEKSFYGVLFIATQISGLWDTEDTNFFETLSHAIILTLQRKSIFESLQEKISELDFSFEVGTTSLETFVGSTQSIDEATTHILDGVQSILKVDRASLMLWDPQQEQLVTQWVRGGDFKVQSPLQLKWGEGMAGWALKTGQAYWAEYAMGDPHYIPSGQGIQSLLCVPVYTMDKKPLGVINAVTLEHPRAFLEREINFLKTFGQQAALAIENARLHQQNRSHIEQLRELDKMKSQFLSLVSHDLRGPLTGIRGFLEVLKAETRGPLSNDQNELIQELERQVELQERMVEDLLDFARMEKGKLSIHTAPTDLVRLLNEEVDKSQLQARNHQIELSLQLPIDVQMPLLLIDQGRIRQVLWNLIFNALKFTSEGGKVTVSLKPTSTEVSIEVSDTGVGLPLDAQGKIFEKFFQVSPGGSKGAQGLGLGLAICKEIINAHQGKIEAFSEGLGRGTRVRFTLPVPPSLANTSEHEIAA